MRIHYALSSEAWAEFEPQLLHMIRTRGLRRILEIGGGANPLIPAAQVHELGLEYTVLDVSPEELAKAPSGYRTVCADIAAPDLDIEGGYDLAFSRMLAEHVRDGAQFHRNVAALLRPGGRALHFFPTLWAPPFVINRWLPERLTDRLLHVLNPERDRRMFGKFPAYYDWCRGPTSAQVRRFEGLGYAVEFYGGYYGHGQYYRHVPLLQRLHRQACVFLVKRRLPQFTSFAMLQLQRNPASITAPAS